MDPLTVTIPGAAKALGVSPSTIWRRIADGTLQTCRFGSKTLVFVSSIKAAVGADR